MKKRFSALAAVIALSVSAGAFATSIGPQIDFNYGAVPGHFGYVAGGPAVSLKFDALPIYWAFSTDFSPISYTYKENGIKYTRNAALVELSLTADYWVMNPEIIGVWHWFWGFGGAVMGAFTTSGGNFYLSTGPRAVVGMNWFFADGFLELYAQQAFQLMLRFAFGEDGSNNGTFRVPIYFPSAVGLRFWF